MTSAVVPKLSTMFQLKNTLLQCYKRRFLRRMYAYLMHIDANECSSKYLASSHVVLRATRDW